MNGSDFVRHLSGVYWKFRSELKNRLKDYGLGLGHVAFLQMVLDKEGINQEEIKDKLSMDKGSVARSVSKLVQLGFIKKELNLNDKRAFRLYPTLRLKNKFPEIVKIIDDYFESTTSMLGKEDMKGLREVLEKIYND
ncbi:MAG: winged helix-turn-helix transcriptional regulator [Candidatus Delongbacteria bacterium]|nr:winged helix-turn-helix transcriptional regulator [Candidatus Delongbacteria bacterium]MBN2835589.1 winged helix-turn-helix transcriptional regulator [Candidatus Delongbacteria bacterium]